MGRHRLRDLGFTIGRQPPGALNAITDVAGVKVGHVTLLQDEPQVARTGVTAVLPTNGRYWDENVFAGCYTLNGFGEVTGSHWIVESGLLTSPILLSSTFSIGVLRDTLLSHPFRCGVEDRFHQPFCAETNDGLLNDGLAHHVRPEHVVAAMDAALGGPVEEGNVGGGTGMICHEFKGGIGTSSRIAKTPAGEFTVGVLVQSNYGLRRDLRIDGVPVGRLIDYDVVPSVRRREEGSIIIVVATDAPLLPVQCQRLARRGALGLGRVGGFGGNTSGDFILAFSTGNLLAPLPKSIVTELSMLPNEHMSFLFQAVVEATEEAIVNSIVTAETMIGRQGRVVHSIPHDLLIEAMNAHGHACERSSR